MSAGIDTDSLKALVRALEKIGVRPLLGDRFAVTCKQCKAVRVVEMGQLMRMRTLSIALCAPCLRTLQIASTTTTDLIHQ